MYIQHKDQPNRKYREYLRSEEWRRKAEARLKIDAYTCQACGSKGTMRNALEVHHLSYRNLYAESVDVDLVTLCESCHCLIHNCLNRITDSRTGRRGWRDNPTIPKRHTTAYIDGDTLSFYDE